MTGQTTQLMPASAAAAGAAVPVARSGLGMLRALMRYFKPAAFVFAASILLLGADLVMNLGVSVLQRYFIDTIQEADAPGLWKLIRACSAASVGLVAAFMLQHYLRNYAHSEMIRGLETDLFSKINRLPFRTMQHIHSGDLVSRVSKDCGKASELVTHAVYDIGFQAVMLIAAFVYLAQVDFWVAAMVLVTGPFGFLAGRFFDRKIRVVSEQIQRKNGEVRAQLQETLQGMKVVRAFGLEGRFHGQYVERRLELNGLMRKQTVYNALLWSSVTLISGTIQIVCAFLIALAAIRGSVTPGQVVAFIFLVGQVQSPFTNVSRTWGGLQESLGAAERVFGVLDRDTETGHGDRRSAELNTLGSERSEAARIAGEEVQPSAIELCGVTFTHESPDGTSRLLFDALDLRVEPGEIVAVVGPSGAGKTTLARLCCGLYVPDGGEVRIFGRSLRDDLGGARSQLTYVPQTPYLFSGTIKDNIAFGMDDAGGDAVVEAAIAANAHSFIERLERGYDTPVGEHGAALSGGQRQRIALARAFVRQAPLLILDEATSALDNESERLVMQSVERLMRGHTALIIAHRLSTVRHATRIVVMERGRIAEQGTHDGLLAANGLYASLYRHQFAG